MTSPLASRLLADLRPPHARARDRITDIERRIREHQGALVLLERERTRALVQLHFINAVERGSIQE